MSNPEIVELIAAKLKSGDLVHPGDPDKDIPPTPIALPFKSVPGMPEEMTQLMDRSAQLLAEAVVSIIETDGDSEIVPRTEAKAMRKAVGEGPVGPQVVPLHCRCGGPPLAMLSVTDPDRIIVDGSALILGLTAREAACPHKVKS